jgi:hypothetical protein
MSRLYKNKKNRKGEIPEINVKKCLTSSSSKVTTTGFDLFEAVDAVSILLLLF